MATRSNGLAVTWLAAQAPERPAVVHEGRVTTRGELERLANRTARAFAARGVAAGDLVTIALPNGFPFLAATVAAWKLGATPQPVSARLPAPERRALVELGQPALVVGAPEGEAHDCPTLPLGWEPEADLDDAPLPDVTPACVRAMTSGGSTGRPKLILDTSPGTVDPEVAENGMQVGGTTLVTGPLYHAGPFITCWQCLLSGGTAVVMTRFDAEESLRLIEAHRVDWVLFVPTMMQRIWKLPDAVKARSGASCAPVRPAPRG